MYCTLSLINPHPSSKTSVNYLYLIKRKTSYYYNCDKLTMNFKTSHCSCKFSHDSHINCLLFKSQSILIFKLETNQIYYHKSQACYHDADVTPEHYIYVCTESMKERLFALFYEFEDMYCIYTYVGFNVTVFGI